MSTHTDRRNTTRTLRRVGLVAAVSGLIVAAGFASEYALAAHFITGPATYETLPGVVAYVGAVLALAALMAAVGAESRRGVGRRGFDVSLIAVSAVGVLFFGWLSLLGAQFAAGAATDETGYTWLLYLAAFAAPAFASLVAAIVIYVWHPRAVVPALIVLATVAVAVVLLVIQSTVAA